MHGRLALAAGTVAVLVPAQALIIPQFLLVTHLGWQNTFAGLIVPQLSGCAVPLLLLRQQVRRSPPASPRPLFLNTEGASPGPLLAAATLAALPVLAVYGCAARQITNAFMHSGIG